MYKYFIYLIFIALFGSLIGCFEQETIKYEYYSKEDSQIDKVDSISILYSEGGKVRLRITGPKMNNIYISTSAAQEFSSGILVEFFENKDTPQSQVTAGYAIRDLNSGEVVFRDRVVFESLIEDKTKLKTQELIWKEHMRTLETSKFVSISNRLNEVVRGYGFRSSEDFKRYELGKGSGIKNVENLNETLGQ